MALDQARAPSEGERSYEGTALLTARADRGLSGDPSTVRAFCCGSYVSCPVWRAERERGWEGRRALEAPEEPG